MAEVSGIESLKCELDFGFALFGAFKAAKADGHLGLEDLGLVLTLVNPATMAFNDRLKIGAELKDLSADEAQQLAEYVAGKLGAVADAALVSKVVAVMGAMKANYAAYKAFVA